MKFYTLDEMIDKHIGLKGTKEREDFDVSVQLALIGNAIKEARDSVNLTQKELGERVGVSSAQISKLESGKNLNFATISKAFRAMGVAASLNFGGMQVALW